MIIETFVLSAFQQNTRVIACKRTGEAICIDPGDRSPELVEYLQKKNYDLKAITLTHGHLDHVGGTSELIKSFPKAEIILHKDDEDLYYGLRRQPIFMGIPETQLKALGFDYEEPPQLTRNWEHGEIFTVGDLQFEIRHCPGHTRGHVVLIEHKHKCVLVGDCLFSGSIGRTDLPGGDQEQLLASINDNILSLEDDFTVYSGHGSETTVGRERTTNPFLNGTYQIGRGRYL
jgi:hydroxyacylglutathione hydrolase